MGGTFSLVEQPRHAHGGALIVTCSIGLDGTFVKVNPTLSFVVQYTQQELLNSPVAALLRRGENVRKTEREIFDKLERIRALDDGTEETFDSWMQAKDGLWIKVRARVTWNDGFQRWDIVAEVDTAQLASRPRPQFPPDDPYVDITRALFNETLVGRRQQEIRKLTELLEEHTALLRAAGEPGANHADQAAAAAAAAAAVAAVMAEMHRQEGNGQPPGQTAEEGMGPAWDIPQWRTYVGFRGHVLRTYLPGMSRTALAGLLGASLKTFRRARLHYHVDHLWPPTRWPEHLAALAAAALVSIATIDSLDTQVGGTITMCLQAILHFAHTVRF